MQKNGDRLLRYVRTCLCTCVRMCLCTLHVLYCTVRTHFCTIMTQCSWLSSLSICVLNELNHITIFFYNCLSFHHNLHQYVCGNSVSAFSLFSSIILLFLTLLSLHSDVPIRHDIFITSDSSRTFNFLFKRFTLTRSSHKFNHG